MSQMILKWREVMPCYWLNRQGVLELKISVSAATDTRFRAAESLCPANCGSAGSRA